MKHYNKNSELNEQAFLMILGILHTCNKCNNAILLITLTNNNVGHQINIHIYQP